MLVFYEVCAREDTNVDAAVKVLVDHIIATDYHDNTAYICQSSMLILKYKYCELEWFEQMSQLKPNNPSSK